MSYKSIEIYYDVATIPGISDRDEWSNEALAFRNRAMEFVEDAISGAGVGEWAGAEIGSGEVNFGFDVDDFDRAEAVVREAVAGTEFEGIREIQRREISEEEMEQMMQEGGNFKMPLRLKIMLLLAIPVTIVLLLFKLLMLPMRLLSKR